MTKDKARIPRRRLTNQEVQLITKLADLGVPIKEIANTIGVTDAAIRYWFAKLSIRFAAKAGHSVDDIEKFRNRMASEEFRARYHLIKGDTLHQNARQFVMTRPDGSILQVTNLKAWCQQNEYLFPAATSLRIYQGFVRNRRYKGWTIERVMHPVDEIASLDIDWTTDPRPLWACVSEWRKNHRWTWKKTARKLGQHEETVKKWCRARIQPRNTLPTRIIMTLIDAAHEE